MESKLETIFSDKEGKPFFILDLANNHMGNITHGLEIIHRAYEICKEFENDFVFGLKFQYRDIDSSFIHPDFKHRMDIKYVKRFSETKLTEDEFQLMKDEVKRLGFVSICTPFDERSVDLVEKQNFEIIKIASCSFNDWPLLERVAKTDKPLIASTAGATFEEIDPVVSFLEHRDKKSAIMHCVGEYPTKKETLQLNQIDLLKKRYPSMIVGFSTHEEPENIDSIKIAVAKGAKIFERHIDVESDNYKINAYSSTPTQLKMWLNSARDAYSMCGIKDSRHISSEKEKNDLRTFKRGVFAKTNLKKGDLVTAGNVFYAFPCNETQLVANDIAKYIKYTLEKDVLMNSPIEPKELDIKNTRRDVLKIVKQLKDIVIESNIALPPKVELELSHHYGVERYIESGAAILNCINREYCKKLLVLLPGQKHPLHYHLKKEETFHVLHGSMNVTLNGKEKTLKKGDMQTVERGVEHDFSSKSGCIFEEISTTHYKDDSFYKDEAILKNPNRKTNMTVWSDWFYRSIK
jgi:sialic acid synthase SpsE/quercetin dioxygenase-like cupin family protein